MKITVHQCLFATQHNESQEKSEFEIPYYIRCEIRCEMSNENCKNDTGCTTRSTNTDCYLMKLNGPQNDSTTNFSHFLFSFTFFIRNECRRCTRTPIACLECLAFLQCGGNQIFSLTGISISDKPFSRSQVH